ncbi:hypothetical protein P3X46_026392 [Hevea brasiliensis]|uniref:Uncharacterized protein n=1 Tax=Hevea brasiliensis TaxID=3981 RepID=A0ABQ9KWH1_HEVBR|nr:transcription termination factor MTEF1, chloroplastic [Hevea brasiliensis]KAJ9152883.1 hypothetical protein P3X46_026392 [Hevea brasiliensis]
MLRSLSLPPLSFNSPSKTLKPYHLSSSSSLHPPFYLRFRTSNHENLRYLKAIGVIDRNTKPHQLPSPDAITQILSTINFFKSKGFQDTDFSRLTSICPQLISNNFDLTDVDPVFQFLASDLHASVQESRGLIFNCPQILFSDVEYCLRPTLNYLRQLGVAKLNVPSKLNAHLLNIREEKLRSKIKFLKSVGLSHKEAASFSARIPAIFGYSIENNLRPKLQYLLEEMERSMEELKEFPQYFGFSLEKRIVPRHLHLKKRDVRIKLNRMLMWSDQRFYAKWK